MYQAAAATVAVMYVALDGSLHTPTENCCTQFIILQLKSTGRMVHWHYTLPGQWSLITISQYNHSFHPMFPTDHCRLLSIDIPSESEMAL